MNPTIRIGTARIALERVELAPEIVLDEVHLDGGDVRYESPAQGCEATVASAETRVRAVMSEANLNRLVAAKLPADAPIRGLNIALLSGRARISGKALISIVPFPFSIEATPVVENGVRISLDCRTATLGVEMPRTLVEVLQARINEALSLDVSTLEIPLWIDEIRCEPGRLSASGRARIVWPPETTVAALRSPRSPAIGSGFRSSATPLFAEAKPAPPALTGAPADPSPEPR